MAEWVSSESTFPEILDRFLNLYQNINPAERNIDEIIFGEHYNKMVAAVETLQSMIVFVPSTSASSGGCGIPFLNTPSCPGTMTAGPGNTGGDHTLTSLSAPYNITISLQNLLNNVCPNIIRTHLTSGGVLPFELVITRNLNIDYSECPVFGATIIQNSSLFDYIKGTKSVLVSARAMLYRDFNSSSMVEEDNYRPDGYINDVVVNCSAGIKPNFLFLRGYIIDTGATLGISPGMWTQWTGTTQGGAIRIQFSIVKLN